METRTLDTIVKEIKLTKKEFNITPRFLFKQRGYERRTLHNCSAIDKYLEENLLEVVPHYNDVWIDHTITLKHKDIAKRKISKDPIIRLQTLRAAIEKPICIKRDSKLDEAITIMRLHNYSQLPVISGNKKLCGYISWTTIGIGLAQRVQSDSVNSYMHENVKTISPDTPILTAIRAIHKHDFIIVVDKCKELLGIITTTDISSQFLELEEPFLLLEQIENQIRQLIDEKFLLEDIKKLCKETSSPKEIRTIEDLTFGDYIYLIENPERWSKLKLKSVNRIVFIEKLKEIKNIRNDIMHFEPAGITSSQHTQLKKMSDYLTSLLHYNQRLSISSDSVSGEKNGM